MSPSPSSKPGSGDQGSPISSTGLIPVRSYDRYRDGKLEEVSAYTRRGVIQAKPRNNNRSVLNSMWEAAATQLMALDPGNPELDKTLDPNWMPETADVADIWEVLEHARADQQNGISPLVSRGVSDKENATRSLNASPFIIDIAFPPDAKENHDALEEYMYNYYKGAFCQVERQVPFQATGTSFTTIPDLVVQCPSACGIPNQRTFFVEIKTGESPPISERQQTLFPLLMAGGFMYSASPKITTFGFILAEILPPMPGYFGISAYARLARAID